MILHSLPVQRWSLEKETGGLGAYSVIFSQRLASSELSDLPNLSVMP